MTSLPKNATGSKSSYDRDVYAWSLEQARLLAEGRLAEIDLENIADEVSSVGKQELSAVEEALIDILHDMLVWDHGPNPAARSLDSTAAARREVEARLARSPSLSARLSEAVEWSYGIARLRASSELDVDTTQFPETCPYSWDEIMSRPLER